MADRYEEKARNFVREHMYSHFDPATDRLSASREWAAYQAFAAALREQDRWYEINDPEHPAPRDGTKVDLLYPYPRGRQVDCYWTWSNLDSRPMWGRREPRWEKGELLPEEKWFLSFFPNMEPTHWRPAPLPPPPQSVRQDASPSPDAGGA
jgi:hypothetical protein